MAKYSRTIGADKNFRPSGRVVQYTGIYLAFVKDNEDAQRMGRLRVWVPEFGSQPDDEGGWITVSYVSPFAGATNPALLGNNVQVGSQSQTSYGWWAVPPDLDNQVVVMFIEGDPTRGVWLGSLYQQFMNHMVPGIPAAGNFQHGQDLPVTEYNKKTTTNVKNDITRPELTGVSNAIASQGLINDNVRGTTDSGARRESPSQVYGLLTPGPVDPNSSENEKGRKRLGGSQFYLDDGEGREHVRIRTRSGAQLLIDETNGLVYAINKAGTSWMQMDADGNFDVFAAKSVSIRSLEDINYRADRDINLEAGRDINLKARKDYLGSTDGSVGGEGAGSGGNITLQALANMQTTVKDSVFFTVQEGDVDMAVGAGDVRTTVTGSLDINVSEDITATAGGAIGLKGSNIDLDSGGNLGVAGNAIAGGTMYATDFRAGSVGLVGHEHTYIVPLHPNGTAQTSAHTGGGGSSSATGPTAATATASTPVSPVSKTNVLSTFADPDNFTRNTETVLTVVGRFITYEPCPEHVVKGQS